MVLVSIEHDDFGQVTIEIRQVLWHALAMRSSKKTRRAAHLYDLAVDKSCGFTEEFVIKIKVVRIQFLHYRDGRLSKRVRCRLVKKTRCTHVVMLRREYDYLIKLREICDEVVHPWSLCGSPAVLTLRVGCQQHTFGALRLTHIPL